ncbi:Glu/Leu/Phe/Val dehydrogenase dimerization domain-containing protein [Streptomyces sp. MST-110588]|uniref:Leu/Phe/Val dehydrogenase n=1 Tax=Streptomyces sp. MST-110588 TaxID=2833628 RepID=UPI001F5D23EF|nr:Glu/Leu/Phe/Val dehydrogenase dimerization domain-containing protein [Streptomyces sp. MST-110588]UNO38368.1 Glu/Leu/Phe/Val dehydrogenase [Streptomyces sp. MST-110588]
MGVFDRFAGHEQVLFTADQASGLRCVIAIHSTALGPSLGGTRFVPYATEEAALADALRLSRAMTYKAACAGLDIGGGKGIVIGDPSRMKTEAVLRGYGQAVESLGGRYIAACDMGTTPADLAVVGRETRWARGTEPVEGGSGDSARLTAYGVYLGIKASLRWQFGDDRLDGCRIAIDGVGKVGLRLAGRLYEQGAQLYVADIDTAAAEAAATAYGAVITPPEKLYGLEADVLSPNSVGGVLNEATLPELRCRVIAGAANNQLATEDIAGRLAERGILYAPDFVVNAGGLIQVVDELHEGGPVEERARACAETIPERLTQIFARAADDGVSTERAAVLLAEERLRAVGRLRSFWSPWRHGSR